MKRLRPMKSASAVCLPLLLLLASCGDDGTAQGGGGAAAGGGAQGGAEEGGAPAGGAPEGGGAPDNASASLRASSFTASCDPAGADPVAGSLTVVYDNSTGEEAAFEVIDVSLVFADGAGSLTWTFDVDPSSSGPLPAFGSVTTTHVKVADSGSGDADPCAFCGASATLVVRYVDGTEELGSLLALICPP